ncbi:amino acid ABC transporter permease [Pantoea cypripedii]|uniref:ABC transporter permease n=1 Tax=Pantoea cypripedii TaxID=55209 RepID=A0A6B9G9M6_PANCY|nr:amino acid ABC transporter permease [Pantoea cypripedii]QGY33192.1 ABC transporter permease [Pantoea cypripedii]
MQYTFDYSVVFDSWQLLLKGAWATVELSFISGIFSLMLGIVLMIFRRGEVKILNIVSKALIEIVRNTPFLVQLFFVFFGLPLIGLKFTVTAAAITALTLNTACYIAETMRGGVNSLPKGLVEAGKALGMNNFRIFVDIILKPALRSVYPALSSQFILLLLTSSVVASISANELTYTAQVIESNSFRSFEVYTVVTGIYFVLALGLSLTLKLFGRIYFSYPNK